MKFVLKHLCFTVAVKWRLGETTQSRTEPLTTEISEIMMTVTCYFTLTYQAVQHLKQHSTEPPPVHCWAVGVASQHLGSQVLWGSTECMHHPTNRDAFLTETKVGQHYMTTTVQQDVLWFEVSRRERD